MILLKEVDDPERFGVAELDGDRVVRIVEKPAHPRTGLAVTGCYFYDARVFEITDVNNRYIEWGELRHHVLQGWWTDAGTVPSLHRASAMVAADKDNPVLRPPHLLLDEAGEEG